MIIKDMMWKSPRLWDAPGVFNAEDVETHTYMDEPVLSNYYIYHNGHTDDRYKRVVSLDALDVVMTEFEDDLTPYGFKKLRTDYEGTVWTR